ncbi:hypothetical protein AAC387_Pa02g2792 [Persea americana]
MILKNPDCWAVSRRFRILLRNLCFFDLRRHRLPWTHHRSPDFSDAPTFFFFNNGHTETNEPHQPPKPQDKVVDFHWNASDPWTIVSASDDLGGTGGGGTLQIWRMSDLIYRPEEEVLAELKNFKSHMLSCSSRS